MYMYQHFKPEPISFFFTTLYKCMCTSTQPKKKQNCPLKIEKGSASKMNITGYTSTCTCISYLEATLKSISKRKKTNSWTVYCTFVK